VCGMTSSQRCYAGACQRSPERLQQLFGVPVRQQLQQVGAHAAAGAAGNAVRQAKPFQAVRVACLPVCRGDTRLKFVFNGLCPPGPNAAAGAARDTVGQGFPGLFPSERQ